MMNKKGKWELAISASKTFHSTPNTTTATTALFFTASNVSINTKTFHNKIFNSPA